MKKILIITALSIFLATACSNGPILKVEKEVGVEEKGVEPEKTPMDPVDPEPDYLWPEPGVYPWDGTER